MTALLAGLATTATAAETPPLSRLDTPMADLVVLEPLIPSDADPATPMLLVLDAAAPAPNLGTPLHPRANARVDPRLRGRRRRRAGRPVRALVRRAERPTFRIDRHDADRRPGNGTRRRHRVRCPGSGRFADDRRDGSNQLRPRDRDGRPGRRRRFRDGRAGRGLTARHRRVGLVRDDVAARARRRRPWTSGGRSTCPVASALASLGDWDDAPGDDLLVYASPDCPPGGPGGVPAWWLSDCATGPRSTVTGDGLRTGRRCRPAAAPRPPGRRWPMTTPWSRWPTASRSSMPWEATRSRSTSNPVLRLWPGRTRTPGARRRGSPGSMGRACTRSGSALTPAD